MVTADFGQHVLAVRALLEAAGVTVHVGDVTDPNPAMPYVMLQIPPGVPFDVNVAAERTEFAEDLPVTVVDDSPLNCLRTRQQIREVLDKAVPVVDGRVCFPMRLSGGTQIRPDTSVVIPGTSRHPAFGVDTWSLASTPAQTTVEEAP